MIPVLRMSTTYEKKARITLGYSSEIPDVASVLRQACTRAGAEHMQGEAPQGHLERQVREHFKIGRDYAGLQD